MADRKYPTRRKAPVVLRRFGTTGKPVPVSRRTNDIAKREGYGMFEEGTLKLPTPPNIRGQLDNRQGEATRKQGQKAGPVRLAELVGKKQPVMARFRPDVKLDPSQVQDRRGLNLPVPPSPQPGPAPARPIKGEGRRSTVGRRPSQPPKRRKK